MPKFKLNEIMPCDFVLEHRDASLGNREEGSYLTRTFIERFRNSDRCKSKLKLFNEYTIRTKNITLDYFMERSSEFFKFYNLLETPLIIHYVKSRIIAHIFGNPLITPCWINGQLTTLSNCGCLKYTSTYYSSSVIELAEAMYDGANNNFALSDALREQGEDALADHFNSQEHMKGCWALDLILKKE